MMVATCFVPAAARNVSAHGRWLMSQWRLGVTCPVHPESIVPWMWRPPTGSTQVGCTEAFSCFGGACGATRAVRWSSTEPAWLSEVGSAAKAAANKLAIQRVFEHGADETRASALGAAVSGFRSSSSAALMRDGRGEAGVEKCKSVRHSAGVFGETASL